MQLSKHGKREALAGNRIFALREESGCDPLLRNIGASLKHGMPVLCEMTGKHG